METARAPSLGVFLFAMATAIVFGSTWYLMPAAETPLMVAGALCALVISVYRPLIACLACVGIIGFRFPDAFTFLFALKLPLIVSAWALLSVMVAIVIGRANFGAPPMLRWLLGYALAVAVSCVFALDPARATDQYVDAYIKILLAVSLLSFVVREAKDVGIINVAIMMLGTLIAAVAIYNKLNGIDLVEETRVTIGLTIGSPLRDPNDLALILLVPLSFSTSLMFYGPRRTVGVALVAFTAILLAIIFTQSRGGLIGVVALSAVYGLRIFQSKLLLAVAGAGLIVGLYAAMGLGERSQSITVAGGLDASAMGRVELWNVAVRTFLTRPITGVGMENFPIVAGRQIGLAYPTHNTALQVLVETGLLGGVTFIGMIIASIAAMQRAVRFYDSMEQRMPVRASATACLAAFAGVIAASMFTSHAYTWTFHFLVCLAAITHQAAIDESNRNAPAVAFRAGG